MLELSITLYKCGGQNMNVIRLVRSKFTARILVRRMTTMRMMMMRNDDDEEEDDDDDDDGKLWEDSFLILQALNQTKGGDK